MPEGDVVFRTAKRLHDALAGRRLTASDLRHPRLALVDLSGRTVLECVPRGKHLLLRLSDGLTLHSHLKMDGNWWVYRTGERWRAPSHQIRVVLRTEAPTGLLHALTGWAMARGSELEGLAVTRPSLEDVYLRLTGGDRPAGSGP